MVESASWIWDGINNILLGTKSKRAKRVTTKQPVTEEAPREEEDEEEEEQERYCLIGKYK